MTQSTPLPIAQLRKYIAVEQEVENHPQANQAFKQFKESRDRAVRRSAEFWHDISNVEKDLYNRMMENRPNCAKTICG